MLVACRCQPWARHPTAQRGLVAVGTYMQGDHVGFVLLLVLLSSHVDQFSLHALACALTGLNVD